MRLSALPLLLLLTLTGCLPSSCRRENPRALFPADSLSRVIAEALPVDTLRLVWETYAGQQLPLAHPRTVLFGPDGALYVSDTERNSVFTFDVPTDPATGRELAGMDFAYPYLSGLRGDTLLVFNPSAHRLDFVVRGAVVRRLDVPPAPEGALQYVAGGPSGLFYKRVGEDVPGLLRRLGGTDSTVVPLRGPSWRHAGLLRLWGDSLLSLSGYRPVVNVLLPGGRMDTMQLAGFDSPMLARSRAFVLGDVAEPPLLTASAAPAGPLLFVLNLRPGWLRIDAYDHSGRLQHVLTEPRPGYNRQFYPIDLAARRVAEGYELALVTLQPRPGVRLYRWTPPPG